MAKLIEIDLEYRDGDEREQKLTTLEISFVSRHCRIEYNKILTKILITEKLNRRYLELIALIASEKTRNGSILNSVIRKYKKEQKEIEKRINSFDPDKVFMDQYELLEMILIDNGYREYANYDFWTNNVDEGVMHEVLNKCIYKDDSEKKKTMITN